MWAVFENIDDIGIHSPVTRHVIPCNDAGEIMSPHICHLSCPCHPAVDNTPTGHSIPIIIHEQIQ
jgi:hypothetical protein